MVTGWISFGAKELSGQLSTNLTAGQGTRRQLISSDIGNTVPTTTTLGEGTIRYTDCHNLRVWPETIWWYERVHNAGIDNEWAGKAGV